MTLETVLVHERAKLAFVTELLRAQLEAQSGGGAVVLTTTAAYGLVRVLDDVAARLESLHRLPSDVLDAEDEQQRRAGAAPA